jgi:hypothetical protein
MDGWRSRGCWGESRRCSSQGWMIRVAILLAALLRIDADPLTQQAYTMISIYGDWRGYQEAVAAFFRERGCTATVEAPILVCLDQTAGTSTLETAPSAFPGPRR